LSRMGTKREARVRRLRSGGTKVRPRVQRARISKADLEKKLAEAVEREVAAGDILRIIATSPKDPPGRASAAARAIMSGTIEQIPDVHADPDYKHGPPRLWSPPPTHRYHRPPHIDGRYLALPVPAC
jgi:hypothetical protein